MRKEIIYFDMDGVLADYEGAANYKDNPEKETNGFFTNLEPIKGAVEAFKKLSEHYDCYFLSTAPWSNIQNAPSPVWTFTLSFVSVDSVILNFIVLEFFL